MACLGAGLTGVGPFGMSGEECEVAEQPSTTTAAKEAGPSIFFPISLNKNPNPGLRW
jgi:hypothetical protein